MPSDQPRSPEELRRSLLYRIMGVVFGCLLVLGTYSLTHSVESALLLFIVVATPLYFGTGFYVKHRIRHSKNTGGEIPVQLALSWVFVRGFCIWTIPVVLLVYVFLRL